MLLLIFFYSFAVCRKCEYSISFYYYEQGKFELSLRIFKQFNFKKVLINMLNWLLFLYCLADRYKNLNSRLEKNISTSSLYMYIVSENEKKQ